MGSIKTKSTKLEKEAIVTTFVIVVECRHSQAGQNYAGRYITNFARRAALDDSITRRYDTAGGYGD